MHIVADQWGIEYCMSTHTIPRLARRRRRRKHRKLKLAVAVFCCIIIFFMVYFMRNVTAVFLSVSEASVLAMNTIAVNEAISSVLSEGVEYDDLITITRDSDGNISSLTANTTLINGLARRINRLARENFAALSEEGVSVPLGALTGIEALAGFGPSINIKIIPVNRIESRFVSQFTSAGINQTLHSLVIQVVAEISIILPSQTVKKTAVSEVLVTESVIRGNIPDVYLQGGWLSGGGGLIPEG